MQKASSRPQLCAMTYVARGSLPCATTIPIDLDTRQPRTLVPRDMSDARSPRMVHGGPASVSKSCSLLPPPSSLPDSTPFPDRLSLMPRSFDAPVTRSELSNRIDPGLDVYKHSDVTKGLSEMDQLVLGIAVKKANDDFWKDRLNNAESRQDLERLVSEIVRDARKNGDAEEALQVWKKTVFVLFKEAGETVQALRYIERYLEELHERVRDLKEVGHPRCVFQSARKH